MVNKILTFFQKFLTANNIPYHLIDPSVNPMPDIDKGLRLSIMTPDQLSKFRETFRFDVPALTLFEYKDDFLCNYTMIRLPEQYTEADPMHPLLIIGPYLIEQIDNQRIIQLIEDRHFPSGLISQLREYYNSICYLSNGDQFRSMLNLFAQELYTDSKNQEIHLCSRQMQEKEHLQLLHDIDYPITPALHMKLIEERYQKENILLHAVSQGNIERAQEALEQMVNLMLPQRISNQLRDSKNKATILNTLLRKCVEHSYVHPMHIDHLSTYFTLKIDSLNHVNSLLNLNHEIVRKYCLLVKNHSLRTYSLLVQKIINKVDTSISENLSLSAIADELNVNASYLSTLFKKETHTTLTDYVNKKRIEHALVLLNSSTMQIQDVASHVGIQDVNYFTKIFKKMIGTTPSEYRKMLHKE